GSIAASAPWSFFLKRPKSPSAFCLEVEIELVISFSLRLRNLLNLDENRIFEIVVEIDEFGQVLIGQKSGRIGVRSGNENLRVDIEIDDRLPAAGVLM